MPPSKKRRSRHVEFDEYVPPNMLHMEEPVVIQECHTHYELHGRAVHSLLTVPASPPSTNFVTDDLDRTTTVDEYPSFTSIEEVDEDQEVDNCELEALGLGEVLSQTDERKKRRRTQAVSSPAYSLLTFIHYLLLIGPSTSSVDSSY